MYFSIFVNCTNPDSVYLRWVRSSSDCLLWLEIYFNIVDAATRRCSKFLRLDARMTLFSMILIPFTVGFLSIYQFAFLSCDKIDISLSSINFNRSYELVMGDRVFPQLVWYMRTYYVFAEASYELRALVVGTSRG